MPRILSGTGDSARIRGRAITIAAFLLVVVHLGWRFAILREAYFRQDDFEYVARAVEQPFGWDYLARSHSGQFMPGGFALAWILSRVSPYDWGLTGAVTLALQAVAAFAVYRMLRVLFGVRPAILVPFAIYLFTPMAVPAFAWWAAALNAVPLQIALPMAVAAHVEYVRSGEDRAALAAAGWIVFGLVFFLKAAAIPVLLLAVTSAYLIHAQKNTAQKNTAQKNTAQENTAQENTAQENTAQGSPPPEAAPRLWIAGVLETLRRYRRAWWLYGAVLAAYVPLYWYTLRGASGTAGPPSADDTAVFVGRWLGRTFPVTAVGGPGEWFTVNTGDYAVADPRNASVVAAWSVLAAVVGATAWFRRHGWRAWLILFGWLAGADVLPVIFGRLTSTFAPILGLEARYLADVAPVLTLCFALAALPMAGERSPYRRPVPVGWLHPSTVGLLTAGYVGLSMWSTYGYLAAIDAGPVRTYMSNARASLAAVPPGAVIHDGTVPHYVYWSLAGEYARTRHVLAPLARPDVRPMLSAQGDAAASETPMIFDSTGRLRPATVTGAHADPGPGRCWPQRAGSMTVALSPPAPGRSWTVQVAYLSARPLRMRLEYGDRPVDVTLRQGLGQVTVPIRGRGPGLVMTPLGDPAGVCVGRVVVGVPTAR